MVYADVRFKETTIFKRVRPGTYQFLFAETDRSPMPSWMDIETLDSAFLGTPDLPDTIVSLNLDCLLYTSRGPQMRFGRPTDSER